MSNLVNRDIRMKNSAKSHPIRAAILDLASKKDKINVLDVIDYFNSSLNITISKERVNNHMTILKRAGLL